MNKLVSVLVPAYNVSSYVREALSSVLAQTYKHLEIIVIDDGSTDNTGEILNQLAKSDTRLRIIHNEKNIGIIKTLNKGLNLAKGDYIARMDADDLIVPDWIEKFSTEWKTNRTFSQWAVRYKFYHQTRENWLKSIKTAKFFNFRQNTMTLSAPCLSTIRWHTRR